MENNWISVDEEKPNDAREVLVIGDGWDGLKWHRIYFYENDLWHTIDGFMIDTVSQSKITHWMELPEFNKQ
jgi:hypothetical protein